MIGEHPTTGEKIQVRIGRYGPVIQLGSVEDDSDQLDPIKYVAVPKGVDMKTIEIEEALKLF